jgi:hypothetical protein
VAKITIREREHRKKFAVPGLYKRRQLLHTTANKPDAVKAQRGQKDKVTLHDIIKVLEPYSLFPKSEITRLLKMYSFLILYYVKLGKIVNVPYVGSLMQLERTLPTQFHHSRYTTLKVSPKVWYLAFSPCPFAKWFLNPELFTPFLNEKVVGYYRKLFEFHKEMFHHSRSFDWQTFMPHAENLRVALDYVLGIGNKDTVLTRLAVRSGAIPFTSSLDCK